MYENLLPIGFEKFLEPYNGYQWIIAYYITIKFLGVRQSVPKLQYIVSIFKGMKRPR